MTLLTGLFSGNAVAFKADNGEGIANTSRIAFRHVLSNTGNGFNSSTGIFTAPYSGLHLFEAQLCEKRSYTFSIHKNGYIMIEQDIPASGITTCYSLTRDTYLERGDIVYVYVYFGNLSLHRNVANMFSGYLIQ